MFFVIFNGWIFVWLINGVYVDLFIKIEFCVIEK